MASKVGINSALQEYFGICQSGAESGATPTQLLRKNRSMVAKLRSISDASSWMDETNASRTNNIGWGEAARGWQPVKPYSAYISTSVVKRTTKESFQQTEPTPNETFPVKLHWRDIIKYTNDAIKPEQLPRGFEARKSQLGPNDDPKLPDKIRRQKLPENHSDASKKLQQLFNHDQKYETAKSFDLRKKSRVPLDKKSQRKADKLAKLLRKLPKIQHQNKKDNRTVKRLSPTKSPTKNRVNPTSRINIEYGSPALNNKRVLAPIQSKIRDREQTKVSSQKKSHSSNLPLRSGEIAVKALELKTQMCLHVILPSIESKPETHLEYKKFATQKPKTDTDRLSLRQSTSSPVSVQSKETELDMSFTSPKKIPVGDENFNWKFLPFLPPVLKQEDKTVQKWRGRRKPNTNLVAITQAAAKAGVSSNSISKLQRATMNGAKTTTALPLTAFTVNSHALISGEILTKQ